MMVGCSALGCANSSVKGKKMFRFPWNEARKHKWAVAVKRATVTGELWVPNVGARICEDHFVTGAPSKDPQHIDYVPSLFRYNEKTSEAARKREESYARHLCIEKKREATNKGQHRTTTRALCVAADEKPGAADDESSDGMIHMQDEDDEVPLPSNVSSNTRSAEAQTDTAVCSSCHCLKQEIKKLTQSIEILKRQRLRQVEKDDANSVKRMSEAKVQFYTGLGNCISLFVQVYPCRVLKEVNVSLLQNLNVLFARYQQTVLIQVCYLALTGLPKAVFFVVLSSIVQALPVARKKFPHETQLLAFLMKLRLNVPFRDLAYRFHLDARTVSQSFRTVLNSMWYLCKDLIVFPNHEICESWLTQKELKHFPRLRAIIDCTEVHVARPLNLDEQQVVWSSYKQNTTLKYLVAVNPHGAVMFVSKTVGGRVSDKELTLSSGFMKHLESGDQVLADRGFLLFEEFYERNVQLITPSFVKSRVQLPGQEVITSRRISSSRIIVERAIGHLKKWRVMTDTVQYSLVDIYDEITTVVAALTNLCPPLSKKGEAAPTGMAGQSEQHC